MQKTTHSRKNSVKTFNISKAVRKKKVEKKLCRRMYIFMFAVNKKEKERKCNSKFNDAHYNLLLNFGTHITQYYSKCNFHVSMLL